jgi:hypothetical protein
MSEQAPASPKEPAVAAAAPARSRRPLTTAERLVCTGAATTLASMLLPWYGIPFSDRFRISGFDAFGFAAAALLLTVAAAVVLVIREASGNPPPRPLRSAELVTVAGVWATLVCVYLLVDRPDEVAGSIHVSLKAGVFVALASCAVIAAAGMMMRVERSASS